MQENDKSGHVKVEVGIISGILRRPVQVDFSISDNTAISKASMYFVYKFKCL